MWNGQKSQYIPLKEIAATEAAIQRGKNSKLGFPPAFHKDAGLTGV
jgi:hypothetical protein